MYSKLTFSLINNSCIAYKLFILSLCYALYTKPETNPFLFHERHSVLDWCNKPVHHAVVDVAERANPPQQVLAC